MKHAHPVRVDLKMRTVFNLLGPLTNPAGATAQLLGAPSAQAAELMAGAMAALGLERGFVVHGSDGLDEITTTGLTAAWEIRGGKVEPREIVPEDFAVKRAATDDLRGGDRDENLSIANAVLAGARGPHRDIVLVNAAAALVAAGKAETFLEGMALGVVSIDTGAARAKVTALAEY
jgi:anthranilate phosphoribosyltransferase